jgi:large subunit ribosomal protein L29
MVKKDKKEYKSINSLLEIDSKIKENKLELAKEKGMLVSKTKTANSSKKKELRKAIARLLTQKNKLIKKEAKTNIIKNIKKGK